MKLNIFYNDNQYTITNLNKSMLIAEIIQIISSKFIKVDKNIIRLYYFGKLLEPDTSLYFYNIKDNEVLHMTLKLKSFKESKLQTAKFILKPLNDKRNENKIIYISGELKVSDLKNELKKYGFTIVELYYNGKFLKNEQLIKDFYFQNCDYLNIINLLFI